MRDYLPLQIPLENIHNQLINHSKVQGTGYCFRTICIQSIWPQQLFMFIYVKMLSLAAPNNYNCPCIKTNSLTLRFIYYKSLSLMFSRNSLLLPESKFRLIIILFTFVHRQVFCSIHYQYTVRWQKWQQLFCKPSHKQ